MHACQRNMQWIAGTVTTSRMININTYQHISTIPTPTPTSRIYIPSRLYIPRHRMRISTTAEQSTLGTYIVCTCELCKPLHREHHLCVMLKSQPPAMAQFLSLLCILLICQRRSPPGQMASSSSASRPGHLSELCNVMDSVSGDSGDGYAHVEHVRVAPAILPEQPYDPCSLHTCCTLPTS